jgi:hypothetical protein
MQGGELEFEMQDEPNSSLKFIDIPMNVPGQFIPVPFINTANRIFNDSIQIEMGMVTIPGQNQGIEYAIEENQLMGKWQVYTLPFTLKKSAKVHVRGFNTNGNTRSYSTILSSTFTKTDATSQLVLQTAYAPSYAAAGPNTLIDKIRGSNDFRTGDWQGFQGKDVVAVVSFTEPRDIQSIGVSYLRDLRSWIFDPSSIVIEFSLDGKTFTQAADFAIEKPSKETEEKSLGNFVKSVALNKVKAIRYTISNQGVCPEWHLGAGNPTWIFLDELLFE